MSDWQKTTLGSVLSRVHRKVSVEEGVEYPAVSVQMYGRGLGAKEPFVGGQTTYSTLFAVREGDVVLRTITAFESPVAVATAAHNGAYVSQVFPTYEITGEALPEYLAFVFQSPVFWHEMKTRATGTVQRRKTIRPKAFEQIPLLLPLPDQQRRVVDVMSAVDAQVAAMAEEAKSAQALLAGLQAEWLSDREGMRSALLHEIAHIDVGYAYKSAQFAQSQTGLRLLRGDNIAPGRLQWDGAKYWPEEVPDDDRYRLQVGDVVVGMDRTWIKAGLRVATVRPQDIPGLLVQRVARLRAKAGSDQRLIEFLVNSPNFKAMVLSHQTGTSVPHISGKQIAGFEVWVPTQEAEQRRLGEVLSQVRESEDRAQAELTSLRVFRAALLSSLLNQTIEIPETYDTLLEGAA